MEILRAYRMLVVPTNATKEAVTAAYNAETAMLNPDRFANASAELREHAEKRLHFVTEAYRTIQRQLEFGGVGFSESGVHFPHAPHPKYDARKYEGVAGFSMPELKVKPPKLDLDWVYFAVGIGFLVMMFVSSTIKQAIFYLVLAIILSIVVTVVKRAQK